MSDAVQHFERQDREEAGARQWGVRHRGARASTGDRDAMGEFWPVPDVLAYLGGTWRAERVVRDLASGDDGRFTGVVVFEPLQDGEGDGLLQRESGDFTWRGVTRPAERTLRFLAGPDGTADVRFAD